MPIRQKLMVITMVTAATALLLSGLGIVVSDTILFRGYLERDLSALARIIADNSTAPLSFDDPKSATETLMALKARTHLVDACIYRPDLTIFSQYTRAGTSQGCPPGDLPEGIRFTSSDLTAAHAIMLKNRQIGNLVLRYDLGEIDERRRLYGATVLGVLSASSLIAYLLSSTLRSQIASPISRLVDATAAVSKTRDYGIRAQKTSGDELGVLVDAFNEMLAGIQSRDMELRGALLAREAALTEARSTRDSLETTLGSIGDAVISTDVAGRVMFANRVALSLLGRQNEDVLGKDLDEVFVIVNEFTRERVESPVAKVLREGAIVGMAMHTILVGKDGSETPIDDSGAPIRAENGPIEGTVLVFRDVTARRKADETSRLLAAIVETSGDAIIGNDLRGIITSWNKGAQQVYGYSAEEMIGKSITILSVPGQSEEMSDILDRIAQGQHIEQYQTVRRTADDRIIHVSLTVSPLFDSVGRIIGASKIARDITAQVRAAGRLGQLNEDLQRSNESLARSNEDLERFAFVASHDLQEPLRMITIYSQLLIKAFPEQAADQVSFFVKNIVAGTKRMRELLADLRAYTEIGAPQEEEPEAIDLNTVLETAKNNLQAAIVDNGALITASNLPVVKGSRAHFVSLFQNLIGNAIKYRGAETPRIRIAAAKIDGYWEFEISDNGIGIKPEYYEKIFVPFKRLHGTQIPGTGIGLSICQRIVERYGGEIRVKSEVGRGSSFIFTLPASMVHAAARYNFAERNT
jgi:PAS domain S-box-containing protein